MSMSMMVGACSRVLDLAQGMLSSHHLWYHTLTQLVDLTNRSYTTVYAVVTLFTKKHCYVKICYAKGNADTISAWLAFLIDI